MNNYDTKNKVRLAYFLTGLFLAFMVFAIVILGGCTMYTVHKEFDPTTGVILTDVKIKSTRSFEQPDLSYTRTGADATFDFKAAGADNNTDAIIGLFAPVLQGIMTGAIKVTPPVTPTPLLVPDR